MILPWIRAIAVATQAEHEPAMDALAELGQAFLLAALFTLGLLSVLSTDFAFQWQPVSEGIPARAVLARVLGATLMGMTIGVLSPRWRKVCLYDLAVLLSLWLILLQGVRLLRAPLAIGAWNSFAEIAVLAMAAWALADVSRVGPRKHAPWRLFGLLPCVFGIAHFSYPALTASFVPHWIPAPLFWAYATGALHFSGGLMILLGLAADFAAAGLGLMYFSWVCVLHLPRVAAAPSSRFEWTMTLMAIAISGSALIMSRTLRRSRTLNWRFERLTRSR